MPHALRLPTSGLGLLVSCSQLCAAPPPDCLSTACVLCMRLQGRSTKWWPSRRLAPAMPHRPHARALQPRSGWLEFLREVQGRTAQVVLLTCPTDRLGTPDKAEARRLVAERNRLMRQMVSHSLGGSADPGGSDSEDAGSGESTGGAPGAEDGGGAGSSTGGAGSGGVSATRGAKPLVLLDIDALTQHVSERTTIAPEDYHYQCYLSSNTQHQGGEA